MQGQDTCTAVLKYKMEYRCSNHKQWHDKIMTTWNIGQRVKWKWRICKHNQKKKMFCHWNRLSFFTFSFLPLSLWWWWWLFSHLQGFGENVWPFIPCLPFFFFFKVEISLRTLIPLFRPGSVHSGSASWDDCGQVFPDKLRTSSFPDKFPHYARSAA